MSHFATKFRQLAKTKLFVVPMIAVLLFGGFGCKGQSAEVTARTQPITINYWRVYDDQDAFGEIIAAYAQAHPNVNIVYRKFRYDEYRKELLNALAEDRGPDIFCLHNTWIKEWQPRLLPSPAVLSMPVRKVSGSIKKEVITVIQNKPGMTVSQMANDFVNVVSRDAVMDTEQADPRAPLVPRVYGVPLSVDTLALYYNRNLLNNNGIPKPAANWTEFQNQVKKITRLDELGTIIQPAASIGTADNIERATDILSILMLQNGAQMTDEHGIATFNRIPTELTGRNLPPAAEALLFYTDFANPQKEVYTWNDKMPNSLQAFAGGQTAFFFGYAYHLPTIRNLNKNLNFGITALPQISGNQPLNFANYWLEVVSNKTKYSNEAWDFLKFATSAEQAQKYLTATGKPTALRSLINSELDNLDLSVFASELPTATSWYHGNNADAMETTFHDLIYQMNTATEPDPAKLIDLAVTKINQTVE